MCLEMLSIDAGCLPSNDTFDNDFAKMFSGQKDFGSAEFLDQLVEIKMLCASRRVQILGFGNTIFIKRSASSGLFGRLRQLEFFCSQLMPINASILTLDI